MRYKFAPSAHLFLHSPASSRQSRWCSVASLGWDQTLARARGAKRSWSSKVEALSREKLKRDRSRAGRESGRREREEEEARPAELLRECLEICDVHATFAYTK